MKKIYSVLLLFSAIGSTAAAQTTALQTAATEATSPPVIDAGDTAWMLVATALVFLMTLPGLALFYGGLVRRKNVLNVLMQCLVIAAVIAFEWVAVGYSLAFGSSDSWLAPFIGDLDWAFLKGIQPSDLSPAFISHSQLTADGTSVGTIPHLLFIAFQGMFAIIKIGRASCRERV